MSSFARVSLATVVFAASAVAFAAPAVAAPPKTLAVAKDKLGADTVALVSANGKTLRATQLFTKLFAKLMEARDVKEAVETIKKTCNIDPVNAVDDATIGVDGKDQATVFVALAGVNEQKLTGCVAAIAKKESGKDIKATKKGDIIELRGGKETLYVAWLPGDIIAFASDADDRAILEKALGGGFAKSALAPRVARLNADATIFGAWNKPISNNGMNVKAGDFTMIAAGGNVTARVNAETASPSDAAKLSLGVNALTGMFVPKSAPKEVHALAKSVSVKTNGSDVVIEAKGTDAEILKAIEWATKGEAKGEKKPKR